MLKALTLEPITKEAPVIPLIVTIPTAVPGPAILADEEEDDTPAICFLCAREPVAWCDNCDKPVCKEHALNFEGWCHIQHIYCPEHHALKMQFQGYSE